MTDLPVVDPVRFAKELWPHVYFYRKQREVMESVVQNERTIVVAGNKLGKDFVTGYLVLWFFLTREPCRVITTSVDGLQLEGVLWGEIRSWIQSCKYELDHSKGGPLVINHLYLRKIVQTGPGKGKRCGISYCMGRVAAKGEGMLGHHVAERNDGVPRTFFAADEASGVDDLSYDRAETWAKRMLIIGNPYPCNNFFYRGVKAGDLQQKPFTLTDDLRLKNYLG